MTKYRRKAGQPIEAAQFREGHLIPPGVIQDNDLGWYVVTIHGQATKIVDGDWILPEPDGVHYYPVKPHIFERTYDEVVEDIDMDDSAELFDKPINGPKGPAIIMACDVGEELMHELQQPGGVVFMPAPSERYTRFRDELQGLINSHSMENGSNTPDFMLATFLTDQLMTFDNLMARRDGWWGGSHAALKGKLEAVTEQLEAEGAHTEAGDQLVETLREELRGKSIRLEAAVRSNEALTERINQLTRR